MQRKNMRLKPTLFCGLFSALSFLEASHTAINSFGYGLNDYDFLDPATPFHITGDYRYIGEAEVRRNKNGHFLYSDASAAFYYSQFLDPEDSLTWSVGYEYLKADWQHNPYFKDTEFNYCIGSLGFT